MANLYSLLFFDPSSDLISKKKHLIESLIFFLFLFSFLFFLWEILDISLTFYFLFILLFLFFFYWGGNFDCRIRKRKGKIIKKDGIQLEGTGKNERGGEI